VEQYTKVLLPNREGLDRLKIAASEEGKWKILEEAKEHAEWEKHRREREQKKEDEKEAEKSESHASSETCLSFYDQSRLPRSIGMIMPSSKQSSSLRRTPMQSYLCR